MNNVTGVKCFSPVSWRWNIPKMMPAPTAPPVCSATFAKTKLSPNEFYSLRYTFHFPTILLFFFFSSARLRLHGGQGMRTKRKLSKRDKYGFSAVRMERLSIIEIMRETQFAVNTQFRQFSLDNNKKCQSNRMVVWSPFDSFNVQESFFFCK